VDPGYQKRQEVDEDMTDKEVYRRAIGSLLYLAINTRPDIAVGTSILSRHVENPKQSDRIEVKRIYRYLKKTQDKRLKLGAVSENQNNDLTVYVDSDWGGDRTDRKSNSGEIPRNSMKIQTYGVQGHPGSSILVSIESPY